jgi:hypothetical protein
MRGQELFVSKLDLLLKRRRARGYLSVELGEAGAKPFLRTIAIGLARGKADKGIKEGWRARRRTVLI